MAGTTAFLFTRQQIYEADAKLLVTTAGGSVPVSEVTREDESRFYATQIEILTEQTMLHRVQLRMRKTPDEIRENLADLKVEPVRGAAILMIRVQSPSADFAKDFANTLCEEYMHFRDEQRAQSSESALLMLTREIKRLGEEKQAATEKMLDYAKQNHVDPMGSVGFAWYKRFNMLNYGYTTAAKAYNEAKTARNYSTADRIPRRCWPCWRRNTRRVSIPLRKGPPVPMMPGGLSPRGCNWTFLWTRIPC